MSEQMGRTFTLFPKLPPEIRIVIWTLAKPAGRIIEINQIERSPIKEEWNQVQEEYWRDDNPDIRDYEEDEHVELVEYNRLWGFQSNASIPALLLACRESHHVASKWFERVFTCSGDVMGPGSSSIPQTYFNYQEDTLLITPDTFSDKNIDGTDQLISYELGVDGMMLLSMLTGITTDMGLEPDFARVENLALVLDDDNEWYPGWDSLLDCLAEILERTFSNLKTFTIVTGYYISSLHWPDLKMTMEEEADLVFMSPRIDVYNAFSFYQPNGCHALLEDNERTKPRSNSSHFLSTSGQERTKQMLEDIRQDCIALGGLGWKQPKIEFKVVTPSKVRSALVQRKRQYEAAIMEKKHLNGEN
ncbi:hypothetical protein NHQ30_009550 [Ciborinia camelliae]|nr:hypothetical protein NHQ30_009550 [Ciborinia camelliae]